MANADEDTVNVGLQGSFVCRELTMQLACGDMTGCIRSLDTQPVGLLQDIARFIARRIGL